MTLRANSTRIHNKAVQSRVADFTKLARDGDYEERMKNTKRDFRLQRFSHNYYRFFPSDT